MNCTPDVHPIARPTTARLRPRSTSAYNAISAAAQCDGAIDASWDAYEAHDFH